MTADCSITISAEPWARNIKRFDCGDGSPPQGRL
jgi:hypothetical protein